MNKIFLVLALGTFLNSCSFNDEQVGYNFDNFKSTPLYDLAMAVRDDNGAKVNKILKNNKLEVDFKDPKFQQTLLSLAIQNEKREAFIELLKAGANPNELVSQPVDATPFIYAIQNVENCDLFFVKKLLEYKANPNQIIKNPSNGFYNSDIFPLHLAVGNFKNDGSECIELVKLLVDNGADINFCVEDSMESLCKGVIHKCLLMNCMGTLRYFVVEKKINIPDTVISYGAVNKSTQKNYSLKEALITEDFGFSDDGRFKEIKKEILEYLDKKK